jgi:hypothetical protein
MVSLTVMPGARREATHAGCASMSHEARCTTARLFLTLARDAPAVTTRRAQPR